MASISTDSRGLRRILFVHPDGARKTIRLGRVSQRAVDQFKYRVERLVEAVKLKQTPDPETAAWVDGLESRVAKRLARVGLIPQLERKAAATLGPFLADFTERRIDVKPATKEVWQQVVRNLKEHFSDERELATITEGDAEDIKLYLIGQKLAPTTVHKRLQFARMFFRAAKKRKLIAANPFAEVSAKSVIRQDRQRFITREEAKLLMEVCNPTWQVIVALCRFGGLRCPSEVLSLQWENVNWETGRIVVQSPKTEHHPGKGSRTIPLFPELRTILWEAHERADDGAIYVVDGDHRKAAATPSGWRNCNLRTQFERLVKRAGLEPWPRLFHAMRASRETELAKDYPLHVVTSWLGNTPRIAMKHYLQVTDEDFERAGLAGQSGAPDRQGGAQNGAQAAHNRAQQPAAPFGSASNPAAVNKDAASTSARSSGGVQGSANPCKSRKSGEDRIRTCGRV